VEAVGVSVVTEMEQLREKVEDLKEAVSLVDHEMAQTKGKELDPLVAMATG
jgi:tetrahydromethanopterin S-methyltransferase subunit G